MTDEKHRDDLQDRRELRDAGAQREVREEGLVFAIRTNHMEAKLVIDDTHTNLFVLAVLDTTTGVHGPIALTRFDLELLAHGFGKAARELDAESTRR